MFALADIDQTYIFKTVLKICESYSEAFLQRDLDYESPPIGLFNEKQLHYIAQAREDIEKSEEQIS